MAEYLVQGDTLSAVAEEIRLKTGLADALTPEQMVIDIAASPSTLGDVPDYVQTEAERVAAAVSELQTENALSFIALSDIHVSGTSAQSIASITHAMQAARIIAGKIPIDFTAVLGDMVNGALNTDTLETHLANHMEQLRILSIASPLRLVGNHDAACTSVLDAEDTYRYIGRFNGSVVKSDTEPERGYFYFDLTDKLTRVICLNTSDLADAADRTSRGDNCIGAKQFKWLISALDMTGKDGWRVLLLSHHPVHWSTTYMRKLLVILEGYTAGSSGSIAYDSDTITFDFTGKNAARLLPTVHGHTHNFIQGQAGSNEDIFRIGTPNACFNRNNEYGADTYGEEFRANYGETTTYTKTANSAKDTAFCVYTIDFANELVYATCYGAGYDRSVSYGGSVLYSITTNLTKVTIDNAASSVVGGESFTATLSAPENYMLDTVTVTMGGEDITSTAYADGVVTIAEVTGDVVITATAIGFTNQIPLSINSDGTDFVGENGEDGYKVGYRLSTSSGNESAQSGISVTGFIPVSSGDVIRIKNIDPTDSNATYATYTSAFARGTSGYCKNIFGDADENGVRSWTIAVTNPYLRISGVFGDNPILTINEEIIDIT